MKTLASISHPRVRMSRTGIAVGLSLALSSTTLPAMAHAAAPAASATGPRLQVEVDPTIVEAAALHRWIEDEARRQLDGLELDAARTGTVRIEIGGALYDYRITLTSLRDGELVGDPLVSSCECTSEELLDMLHGELPTAAHQLESAPTTTKPEDPPIEDTTSASEEDEDEDEDDEPPPKRRKLDAMGKAGIAVMAVGTATLGTGLVLALMPERTPVDEAPWAVDERDLRAPGFALVGAGGGLVLAGIAFVVRSRSGRSTRPGRASLSPSLGHGRFTLGITGRF